MHHIIIGCMNPSGIKLVRVWQKLKLLSSTNRLTCGTEAKQIDQFSEKLLKALQMDKLMPKTLLRRKLLGFYTFVCMLCYASCFLRASSALWDVYLYVQLLRPYMGFVTKYTIWSHV